MKVSQVTRRMSKYHDIVIRTPEREILFEGSVGELHKDHFTNSMFVLGLACNHYSTLLITVDNRESK